ncbi:MAG: hypothetical protein JSU63_06210 [Phycisphaerales bacterium]|nr:MAG: hypothetical protein JSU63_06210 [Phycisphaerales bacterium]
MSTACTLATSANDNDIVLIAYQSSNAYIYFCNGAGGDAILAAGEIAVVEGVTVGSFVAANFQ